MSWQIRVYMYIGGPELMSSKYLILPMEGSYSRPVQDNFKLLQILEVSKKYLLYEAWLSRRYELYLDVIYSICWSFRLLVQAYQNWESVGKEEWDIKQDFNIDKSKTSARDLSHTQQIYLIYSAQAIYYWNDEKHGHQIQR